MIPPSKSALYVYNAENRLVRATVQSGNNVSVEEYKYDYAGNRIAKSSEGEYTKYLLDVNGELTYVLAEMNFDNTEKCYYTRGDELISQERDGKKSYYVYDGHGSVRALADESGKVTDKYVYDAFGNLISSVGSTKNDFLFAGEQFNPVTGLYYLRARYMDTSTGRFISQDTYQGDINDPVSLHKYLYANANPVTYSDPSGYLAAALVGGMTIDCKSTEAEVQSKTKIFHELCDALSRAKTNLSSFGQIFLQNAQFIAPFIAAGTICVSVDIAISQIKDYVQDRIEKKMLEKKAMLYIL